MAHMEADILIEGKLLGTVGFDIELPENDPENDKAFDEAFDKIILLKALEDQRLKDFSYWYVSEKLKHMTPGEAAEEFFTNVISVKIKA